MIPPFPRLSNARRGARNNRSGMIVPMLERCPRVSLGARGVRELVEWMNVENSVRWAPRTRDDGSLATYCDHAVADFLDQLHGAGECPFPAWVWWTPSALMAFENLEGPSSAVIRSTVRELGAPSLYQWMRDWSEDYGWQLFDTWRDLQDHCDEGGHAGVICTMRHTCVVLPSECHQGSGSGGWGPLTWQAGIRNWSYRRESDWFRKFPETIFACWHPPENIEE